MRNRLVAIIITLFVGAFGLHKFYLGENLAGIMYLLFSWTLIPGILAFFDFLGLALMSEESFNRKFNGIREPYRFTESPRVFVSNSRQESSQEIAATLGELKKLYDQGIITAEEYETKRRELLNKI